MRAGLCVALAGALSVGLAGPADALSFVFTTASGDSLSAAQSAAFATAANTWSSYLTDNITVHLEIGFTALGGTTLGQTSTAITLPSSNTVKSLLAADATSADDAQAVASLPSYGASDRMGLTTAEAKAIGFSVAPDDYDGTIEFNSAYSFSTSRNPDGTIAAGTYDLIGVAEHEIGHVLGFDSVIDGGTVDPTLLDQFRFKSAGVRTDTAGPAYFSIDDGLTSLANFATGTGDQASHWARGTTSNGAVALMVPVLEPGRVQNITLLDLRAMDVLGYNLARQAAVPEPASWAMVIAGFGLVGGALRRRQRVALRTA